MQYGYTTIEELLEDETFINYCQGNNEKDTRYWKDYISQSPWNKSLVEEAVNRYHLLFSVLSNADLEEQVNKLKGKIESSESATVISISRSPSRGKSLLLKYAAAAVVIIAIASWFFYRLDNKVVPPAEKPGYVSNPGEKKIFQFPDGTQVTMNAGSDITLAANFGQKTREVYLQGEAFFDVQHNKDVPFIVHTSDMDIRAVGTAFNVRSYNGDKHTETVLVRGLVEVTLTKDNNKKLLLHPDEKISWGSGDLAGRPAAGYTTVKTITGDEHIIKPVKKMDDGSIREVAWVENNLVIDDEPFEEIAPQLSRWYGVSIEFKSDAVKNYHFTATFKKEKIEQVLDILKSSKPFNYHKDGPQSITIY